MKSGVIASRTDSKAFLSNMGLPASRLASAFASSAGAVPKALCVRRFVLYRFACGDPVLIYNI